MNGASARPTRWLDTLLGRLLLAIAAIAILLTTWLLQLVVPATGIALSAFTKETILESSETLREVSTEQTATSSQVLVDLIRYTSDARERALHDLPLESLGGDVAAIRDAVLRDDAERVGRQRRNVVVLAEEMQRRADAALTDRVERLFAAKSARERQFVQNLGKTHLQLTAATLGALLLLVGFGLHRFVVRPTKRLRDIARRVADGELSATLPPAGRGELGDLTRDFARMLEQLRASRGELQHLADNLEHEVQRKTRDLQQSHRKLAQAERLAALGTLSGGVAHEFHNVIGGIRGCADELLRDEGDEDRRETLAVITRAADRAAGIVQQLQRFAHEPAHEARAVDLNGVLADALTLCEPAARRQGVQVERDFAGDAEVAGEADGLHQVFVNLFVNALQAMPGGGRLTVATADDGEHVVVRVRDTGGGIPEQALPHVFEPFFTTKADNPDPERRGSGLGLSVSYGIVSANAGEITAGNADGGGAEFVVRLPRT